jgi:hypothetical protein
MKGMNEMYATAEDRSAEIARDEEFARWDVEVADDIESYDAYLDSLREEVHQAVGFRGEVGVDGTCRRCAGTGRFITYMENGVPKGPGGPCFRCDGKGFQTEADQRRNWGYDNFAPILDR